MNTSELLDLFNVDDSTRAGSSETHRSGVDALGAPMSSKSGKGLNAVLENLGELWEETQYTDEFDIDAFVSAMKNVK